MSLLACSLGELSHPCSCWEPFLPQTPAVISSAGYGVTESDWFAPERDIETVKIILAIGFLTCLASYLPAAPKAEFGEARLLLLVIFRALVHMLPPLFHSNTNAF
jgi:hypothetical protein